MIKKHLKYFVLEPGHEASSYQDLHHGYILNSCPEIKLVFYGSKTKKNYLKV